MTSMMIVTKKDADEMNGDRFHYKTTSAKSETPTSISIWSNPQMHSNQFNIQPNLAKDQHFHNDKKLRWKLEIVTTTTFFSENTFGHGDVAMNIMMIIYDNDYGGDWLIEIIISWWSPFILRQNSSRQRRTHGSGSFCSSWWWLVVNHHWWTLKW